MAWHRIGDILILTLKRPGLCGWLRPTQFKPRLDWVGSAAQVRRYCVDSAAQAFIHALAGCVPRSSQYALCGPRNSRPTHFAAHALDVLAAHEPPSLPQLTVLSDRVKNVYHHLLHFLTLMFSSKVETNQYIFICHFWDRVNPWRPSDTYMGRIFIPFLA